MISYFNAFTAGACFIASLDSFLENRIGSGFLLVALMIGNIALAKVNKEN